MSAREALTAPLAWDCSTREPGIEAQRVLMRFAIPADATQPRVFLSRRIAMKGLDVATSDAAGDVRSTYYTEGQLVPAHLDSLFMAPLPRGEAPLREVVVAVDWPTQQIVFTRAHLSPGDPGDSPHGRGQLLFLAALCGMIAMPIVFSVVFYRVLKQSFVLWHAAMVATLTAQILLNSGLSTYLLPIRVDTMSQLMTLSFGLAVTTGAMFAWSYVEPGKLHPLLRKSLLVVALGSLVLSTFHALFPFVIRPVQADLYYIAHLPVLVVMIAVMVDAMRRGSRAIRFMATGWIPLFLVGLTRLLAQVTPWIAPTDAMDLFHVAVVFEVVATAVGVADRFMIIRRQRDRARTEAYLAEQLAGHDPLTGLLNRRSVETRFAQLQADGFHTLAVLDLDKFKDINDRHGHQVGDRVLVACARALERPDDRDTIAVRMGGEEFLLLLRGKDTRQKVEAFRQSIPLRIAREVPTLDRPVTGSMGVVVIPRDGLAGMDFAELYARADQLLYEAKANGRNRAVWEKLVKFAAAPAPEPQGQAAA